MKLKNLEAAITQKKTGLALKLLRIKEKCGGCNPTTPLKCISGCHVWSFKNEFKKLQPILLRSEYGNVLFNTLKNSRRRSVLKILSENPMSIRQLQRELSALGYRHSCKTITAEYVDPLISSGLVTHGLRCFRATSFGSQLSQLLGDAEFFDSFPSHSECYEEKAVEYLFKHPLTFNELRLLIPGNVLSRVLKRLEEAELVAKNVDKSYIFYFKTRRDPSLEKFSKTTKRVYAAIPNMGISARNLSGETGISTRRIYKYLKKLRGKKLVFKRCTPRKYRLSARGESVAQTLRKIRIIHAEYAEALLGLTRQRTPVSTMEKREKPLEIIVSAG